MLAKLTLVALLVVLANVYAPLIVVAWRRAEKLIFP